jgi:hypothetical protein
MTAEQFTYWLQGFFELSQPDTVLTAEQTKMIREHLATVFQKVTPPLNLPGTWPVPQIQPLSPPSPVQPDWAYRPSITCSGGSGIRLLDEVSIC